MHELILGVDGGGSKTIALLADARSLALLGRGKSGPSNPRSVGLEHACGSITQAIDLAFDAAKIERTSVAGVCLGLSGAGQSGIQAEIRQWATKLNLGSQVCVETDGSIALSAGTQDGIGVALIAGTGSFAFGKSSDGSQARSGGWGYLIGDEGGGYWIGAEAIRQLVRQIDGRTSGATPEDVLQPFSSAILDHFEISAAAELVPALYGNSTSTSKIAQLAAVVDRLCSDGNPIAMDVVDRAAAELVLLGLSVRDKLFTNRRRVPLALVGGLILNSTGLRDRFLAKAGDTFNPVSLVEEPALGAVRIAKRQLDAD